ncbi:metallophosphoesterase, partial [Candidatus Pacearchaeota archaeon]|nr:metallophosphoesterase [Candidatus Pacearchaeota archaeon]
MQEEILNFCIEKGVLIDKEILNIFQDTNDAESIKLIIEKIKTYSNQRMITKSMFENKEMAGKFFSGLPQENQALRKLKIKFGLSIEISNETAPINNTHPLVIPNSPVKAQSLFMHPKQKIEIGNFTTYFRNRFSDIKGILQEKKELDNLISINKLSNTRQAFSIIGMVYDKQVTKNKNIILEVEDLTGKIKVLINQNKPDLYEKAEDIALDSVLGFKGFGNREIFFANDLFFPDVFLPERKMSPVDEAAVFISDVHVGSMHFLERNLLQFIEYLNMKTPEAEEASKIKYLFIVGDLVAGVGAYPGQENQLAIPNLEDQYKKAAELFSKIRKDIKIIIIPGNHDCVRLMEPQPPLDEKFAADLYKLENVIHSSNPSYITIGEKEDFPGFNILAYHGFSYPYYANNIPSLMTRG